MNPNSVAFNQRRTLDLQIVNIQVYLGNLWKLNTDGITVTQVEKWLPLVHVDNVSWSTQRSSAKTRGANNSSETGLNYSENSNSPDEYTITVLGLNNFWLKTLNLCQKKQLDISLQVLDKRTGAGFTVHDCLVTNPVGQPQMGEGRDELVYNITMHTFNDRYDNSHLTLGEYNGAAASDSSETDDDIFNPDHRLVNSDNII